MGDYATNGDNSLKWLYVGEDNKIYGHFTSTDMQKWYTTGYFGDRQLIKSTEDDDFHSLRDYVNMCNGSPFLSDGYSSYNQAELYDGIQRQQTTPIPMNLPMAQQMMIPPNVSSQGYAPSLFINPNSANMANYSYPLLMVPPGMGTYDESQIAYQQESYGINERDNPSSSSVSETPDSERCLHMMEDMRVTMQTFDKSVSTEDAPWLARKVDAATDAHVFDSNLVDSFAQTVPLTIRANNAGRILKEITGIPYNVTGRY